MAPAPLVKVCPVWLGGKRVFTNPSPLMGSASESLGLWRQRWVRDLLISRGNWYGFLLLSKFQFLIYGIGWVGIPFS